MRANARALTFFAPDIVKGLAGKPAAPRLLDLGRQEAGQRLGSFVFVQSLKGRGVTKGSVKDAFFDALPLRDAMVFGFWSSCGEISMEGPGMRRRWSSASQITTFVANVRSRHAPASSRPHPNTADYLSLHGPGWRTTCRVLKVCTTGPFRP